MMASLKLPPFVTREIAVGPVVLPFTVWELILQFLLPIVGLTIALWVLARIVRQVVRSSSLDEDVERRVSRWARRSVRALWAVSVLALGLRVLGAEVVRWLGALFRVVTQPFFTSGNTEISVITLLLVVPIFYFAGWLSRVTRRALEHSVVKRLNLDPAHSFSILNMVRFAVLGLTVIVGLSIVGINLSSLAVLFGVLGIGVGFGLQDAVANMFAGVMIIFSRPIKEGDRVLVDQIEGTVNQIKLLHTIIHTITYETIIIPNSKITGSTMHNYSYDDARIILCNPVQVSYASDLDTVGRVLLEVATRNPWVVPDKDHRYQVWSFDDSGITVRLCTWIADARYRVQAYSWTNLEIWRAFKENGIEIPFPQVDLHVKDSPTPARTDPG